MGTDRHRQGQVDRTVGGTPRAAILIWAEQGAGADLELSEIDVG